MFTNHACICHLSRCLYEMNNWRVSRCLRITDRVIERISFERLMSSISYRSGERLSRYLDAYARTRTYDTYHTPLNLSRRLSFPVQAGLNGLRGDPVNDPRPEGGRISRLVVIPVTLVYLQSTIRRSSRAYLA